MKQFNQDNMKSISDYINNFYEDNPFTKHLGVDIVSIDKGNVCVSLTIKHEHTNVYGIAHGGVIMSLCDMAMGAACLSVGKKVVTLDFNINILKSIDMEDVAIVKGMIIHNGRSTVVTECEVFNKDNKFSFCLSSIKSALLNTTIKCFPSQRGIIFSDNCSI